jgi:16S rRNA processing protein RimM
MNLDSCFLLGRIIKAHGLKGSVLANFDVDEPEQYSKLESVFLEINQKLIPFFIEEISISGKKVILKLEDIDKIDDTESLLKKDIYLPLEKLPEPDEDELFYQHIIGFKVKDKNLGELGVVENIFERAGQDLLVMKFEGKEILIPVDPSIILKADNKKKTLSVDLPEGLLDL